MENTIVRRIKNIMSAVLKVPVEEINKDSSTDTIESWDSLSHMELVVALEKEFDTEYEDEDILGMLNYPMIKKIINKKVKN